MEEEIIQQMIERTVTNMLQDDLQTLIAYAEQIAIGLQFMMSVVAFFLFIIVIYFLYKLFSFLLGG